MQRSWSSSRQMSRRRGSRSYVCYTPCAPTRRKIGGLWHHLQRSSSNGLACQPQLCPRATHGCKPPSNLMDWSCPRGTHASTWCWSSHATARRLLCRHWALSWRCSRATASDQRGCLQQRPCCARGIWATTRRDPFARAIGSSARTSAPRSSTTSSVPQPDARATRRSLTGGNLHPHRRAAGSRLHRSRLR